MELRPALAAAAASMLLGIPVAQLAPRTPWWAWWMTCAVNGLWWGAQQLPPATEEEDDDGMDLA